MSIRINSSHQTNSVEANSLPSRGEVDFSQTLAHTQKLQRQELEAFLAKLDTLGKKLANSLTLRDLKDFRDMVKSFLRSTFGQSRHMQEDSYWDFRGHPKIMAKMVRIDQALEELGQKVLDNHSKPLDILDKIDEIRGLIIDLLA